MKIIGYFFCLLISFNFCLAQNKPIRWGKLSKAEIDLRKCDFDSSAEAVMLASFGQMAVESGGRIYIDKHFRIKILNAKAKNLANVLIPYFAKDDFELIQNLEAQTLNPQTNGEIVKTAVSSDQIFDVSTFNGWKEKRFTFPDVKEGSILEYSYRVVTKQILFLEGWTFQSEIPTLLSEFRTEVRTETLEYKVLLLGNRLQTKYLDESIGGRWVLENLPSLKDEPYVANKWDYAEKIEFQLTGYYRFGSGGYDQQRTGFVNVMTNWEKLAKEILESDDYLNYVKRNNLAQNILKPIKLNDLKPIEQTKKIFDLVRDSFKWNGSYSLNAQQNISNLLESKTGNNAEINMLLALLLKNIGLKADLVLISTRSHGKVIQSTPLLSQFNHYIVFVDFGNQTILLDAIHPFHPFDILAEENLNEEGFLLDEAKPRWINIPVARARVITTSEMDFSTVNNPHFKLRLDYFGFEAIKMRKLIAEKGENEIKKMFSQNPDLRIDKFEIENLQQLDKHLSVSIDFLPTNPTEEPTMFYLMPFIWNHLTENPFKSDQRLFPIEFAHPFEYQLISTIKLPNNYILNDMPKNITVKMPDGFGEFTYILGRSGNTLNLRIKLNHKNGTLKVDSYLAIKEFYTQVLAKLQEQISLKKM